MHAFSTVNQTFVKISAARQNHFLRTSLERSIRKRSFKQLKISLKGVRAPRFSPGRSQSSFANLPLGNLRGVASAPTMRTLTSGGSVRWISPTRSTKRKSMRPRRESIGKRPSAGERKVDSGLRRIFARRRKLGALLRAARKLVRAQRGEAR
jgi:hypothetical protein